MTYGVTSRRDNRSGVVWISPNTIQWTHTEASNPTVRPSGLGALVVGDRIIDSNQESFFWGGTHWASVVRFAHRMLDRPASGRTSAITSGLFFENESGSARFAALPAYGSVLLVRAAAACMGTHNLSVSDSFNLELLDGSGVVAQIGRLDSGSKIFTLNTVITSEDRLQRLRAASIVGSPSFTAVRMAFTLEYRLIRS